jgi:hypothetical protein
MSPMSNGDLESQRKEVLELARTMRDAARKINKIGGRTGNEAICNEYGRCGICPLIVIAGDDCHLVDDVARMALQGDEP